MHIIYLLSTQCACYNDNSIVYGKIFPWELSLQTQQPVRSGKVLFSSYAKCHVAVREITYKAHTVKRRPKGRKISWQLSFIERLFVE